MDAVFPSVTVLCVVEMQWLHEHGIGVHEYRYIHGYSRTICADIDGKFNVHGKPGNTAEPSTANMLIVVFLWKLNQ